MTKYFKPQQTKDNRNYQIVKKTRSGLLIRDQMPCEGIYTEYEMSCVVSPVIPGEWVDLKRSQVVFIFGLRQQKKSLDTPSHLCKISHIGRTKRPSQSE